MKEGKTKEGKTEAERREDERFFRFKIRKILFIETIHFHINFPASPHSA